MGFMSCIVPSPPTTSVMNCGNTVPVARWILYDGARAVHASGAMGNIPRHVASIFKAIASVGLRPATATGGNGSDEERELYRMLTISHTHGSLAVA